MTPRLEDEKEYRETNDTQWTTRFQTQVPRDYSGEVYLHFRLTNGVIRILENGSVIARRGNETADEHSYHYPHEVEGGGHFEFQIASPDGSSCRASGLAVEFEEVESEEPEEVDKDTEE